MYTDLKEKKKTGKGKSVFTCYELLGFFPNHSRGNKQTRRKIAEETNHIDEINTKWKVYDE